MTVVSINRTFCFVENFTRDCVRIIIINKEKESELILTQNLMTKKTRSDSANVKKCRKRTESTGDKGVRLRSLLLNQYCRPVSVNIILQSYFMYFESLKYFVAIKKQI